MFIITRKSIYFCSILVVLKQKQHYFTTRYTKRIYFMDGVRIYWVLSPHTILNRRIIRVHWSSSASRLNPREKIGKKRNNYTHRIHTRATRCRCRGRTDEPRPCCMWQTDILLVCGIRRRRRIWRQRQRGVEQCASADIHIYFCDRKLRNLYTIVNHVGWRWWWWRWQRGFFSLTADYDIRPCVSWSSFREQAIHP